MACNNKMSDNEKVTDKQLQFAIEYVKDFNGTRAAERAGYSGNDATLASVASQNLRILKVRNEIAKLLEGNAMESGEALWRLASMARVDISDFIKGSNGDFSLNWTNVRKYGFLIKSITHTKYGPKIELHDSQKALELIAKHLGLFTDRIDVTSGGQSIDSVLDAIISKSYGNNSD
jgi:phage terminase small subunit